MYWINRSLAIELSLSGSQLIATSWLWELHAWNLRSMSVMRCHSVIISQPTVRLKVGGVIAFSRVWLDRESGFLALGVVIARGLGFDFVDEVRQVVEIGRAHV